MTTLTQKETLKSVAGKGRRREEFMSKKPKKEYKPTKPDLLLQVISQLGAKTRVEDLTVAAWRLDNKAFGLKTYENLYPDVNRVLTIIYGSSGLVKKGLLRNEGDKRFSLTTAGAIMLQQRSRRD